MIDRALRASLEPVLRRQQWRRCGWQLAVVWSAVTLLGLLVMGFQRQTGSAVPHVLPVLAGLGLVAAVIVAARCFHSQPDWRWAARKVEARYPELNGLLMTAVQLPADDPAGAPFLQQQVIEAALAHSRSTDWTQAISWAEVEAAHWAQVVVAGCFLATLWGLRQPALPAAAGMPAGAGMTVSPGDTTLERGSSLVVLARFAGPLPPAVELVVGGANEPGRRIPLVKSLADPVYGGSVPEVGGSFVYHVEYGQQRSRDFKVTVFEYPRVERSDVELTFPAYTGLAPRRIEDTRRISVVEGTRMDLTLHLNQPVESARLVARNKERTVTPLELTAQPPAASLKGRLLSETLTGDVQLLDAAGRTNKEPIVFVIEVQKNRLPELRLAAPRGDLRPSALEEVRFEGTGWDDFGLPAYGLGYNLVGQDTVWLELGREVPGKEKRAFQHLLRLEDLGVKPDQLVSWFVWADDLGPDGQLRRTTGDLFFGEVRPFEEIFREGQSAGNQSQSEDQSESSQPEGNQTVQLAELQKQVLTATWKLQREHGERSSPAYEKDAVVLRDSQQEVLKQAGQQKERAQEPRTLALWTAATKEMTRAVARLDEATNAPPRLKDAIPAEQSAYQALLQLQAREHEVAMARNRSRGQNAGRPGDRQQLDQLDLTQSEDRYERASQAQAPQTPERREQLQVLNRLQELARRQQDLNERLKELQSALQEARTEAQREEARRRLQRLQEEERQMLADMDELRQRMDRPENQSRMQDERRQLDQARDDVQRAGEAASQGAASQALSSGTRAQRQLQQMRDEMRKENSSEFAEEMRNLRTQARDLARQQEEINRQLDTEANSGRRSLSDADRHDETAQQLARQRERLTNLVARATEVSQQSEPTEPLLSRQLYDTLRRFAQTNSASLKDTQEELLQRGMMTRGLYERLQRSSGQEGASLMEATEEMVRLGFLPQARQISQQTRTNLEHLKAGVERAAESVVGDDTEALRLAQQELDQANEELQREMDRSERGESAPTRAESGNDQPAGRAESAARDTEGAASNLVELARSLAPTNGPPRGGGAPASRAVETGPEAASNPSGEPGQGAPDRAGRARERGQRPSLAGPAQDRAGDPGGTETGGDGRNADRMAGRDRLDVTGPITGEDFAPWSDRLREIEEMIDFPDLRNSVAGARERARLLRLEVKRDRKKPDWAQVRLQVVKPLVEVRSRLAEELARRESREALVPIDRDPVPTRYSEMVRRYYEDLGKDNR